MIEQFFDTAALGLAVIFVGLGAVVLSGTMLAIILAFPMHVYGIGDFGHDEEIVEASAWFWFLAAFTVGTLSVSWAVGAIVKTLL